MNQVNSTTSPKPLLKCKECDKGFENKLDEYVIRVLGHQPPLYCSPECEEKALKSERRKNIDNLMLKVGIPPKFPPIKTDVSDYLPLKSGLYIHGKVGTGKTVLACNVAREVIIEEGAVIEFISFPKFIITLQTCYRREEEDPRELLDWAADARVLIIDDMGAEKITPFVRQAIYYIINEREQWQRRTIITSNFTLAELDDYIDSRVSSRIAGMCKLIELKGRDRRIEL